MERDAKGNRAAALLQRAEDRREALSAGFDIHITKAFGIDELSGVLT